MKPQALVTVCVLWASAAFAAAPPLFVNVGYASEVVTRRAYDFVDGKDHLPLLRVGLGYAWSLPTGGLDLGLSYRGGATSGAGWDIPTELTLQGVEAGATWRHPLASWLHPYGRLGLALDWANLQIRGGAFEQTVLSPGVTGQLGTQLRWKPGRFPGFFTADVGVGYTLRPAANFDALAPQNPPERGPANGVAALGSLPLGGISYQLLVGVQL